MSTMRGRSTGHAAMNQQQRELEQREIKSFVQKAFEDVPSFTLEKYLEFNSQISSEMFISVMSILQERLPCSSFYFRERRQFKQSFAMPEIVLSNVDQLQAQPQLAASQSHRNVLSGGMSTRPRTLQPSRKNSAGSQGEFASIVTAIAQPRMINAWSPIKM